ncbi:MAG: type III-A CRISPR-associated RAMP protein Csm3 [Bacteroidetes bacterium]|nr:type III-A CRISPR-associated RAMP protein Csm3 [Bacteroidota bacterium]
MRLFKKIFITGKVQLVTGLHIGDSKESVEIGGVDSPVVRRKDNNEPYIPGSSLKGKMRALLEIATGSNADSKFRKGDYSLEGKIIPELFGSAGDDGMPSRILVRDAYLTKDWAKKLNESEFTDMPFTEIKFENVINRIKGTAEHPRQIERIPAGTEFEIEFIINIIAENEQSAISLEKEYLDLFSSGIRLLEDDYLGGSGTRGYGKVKFQINEPKAKDVNEYFSA